MRILHFASSASVHVEQHSSSGGACEQSCAQVQRLARAPRNALALRCPVASSPADCAPLQAGAGAAAAAAASAAGADCERDSDCYANATDASAAESLPFQVRS